MTTTAKTIRTVTRTSAATGHGTVVRLATAAVLAGMAVAATGGTAAATPSAPLPTFTGYGNGTTGDTSTGDDGGATKLSAMLLSGKDGSTATGVRGLKQIATVDHLFDHTATVSPRSCLSAYAAAEESTYAAAVPQALAIAVLGDKDDSHRIAQAVVALPTKKDALALLKSASTAWQQCAGKTMTRTSKDGSEDTRSFTNGQPQVNDEHTVLSMGMTESDGFSTCERAMAAYRNIVIDVASCGKGDTTGQAVAVVRAIAEKASN